jgi:hypothetical protein
MDGYKMGIRVLQNAVCRPILTVMVHGDLPFQLLAAQAVDAVVAGSGEPTIANLEGDLRMSVIAAVELLLIDLGKPVSPTERTDIASMMLRHFSATGLLSPRDVMRFATRHSEKLAGALRDQPHLIAAETDLSQLLDC